MNTDALATLRTEAGLTQVELARRAQLCDERGVPRRDRLCRIEKGRTEARASEVSAVARALSESLARPYVDVLSALLPAPAAA